MEYVTGKSLPGLMRKDVMDIEVIAAICAMSGGRLRPPTKVAYGISIEA